ncbi:hypothetical protein [Kitasatospora sp. NPDC058397]|uniref:hypothetical protein n=1 Tax=unclassified Kitasatospora TaxID=2633591 RepID=UPI0036516295
MHLRFSPRAAVVVTAGVLALSLVSPSTASAAPGVVIMDRGGEREEVTDPVPGECHRGLGNDTTIVNFTSGPIRLFTDRNCRSRISSLLDPDGARENVNVGSFMAIT